MPTYELAVLFRVMPKDQLTAAIKKTAGFIFNEGGIIRKLNNLGTQPTPFRMMSHGKPHTQASYFVYEFDCPTSSLKSLHEELCKHDIIIRQNVFPPVVPINSSECKIEEETQIAPFRKEVQQMLNVAAKKKEKLDEGKVKPNHGLNYDPFPL